MIKFNITNCNDNSKDKDKGEDKDNDNDYDNNTDKENSIDNHKIFAVRVAFQQIEGTLCAMVIVTVKTSLSPVI